MPEQGKNPFGRPVFQNLQYSDTPTQPLVPMQFTDTKAEAGKKHTYRVIAVNTVGLKSKPSAEATPGETGADLRRPWLLGSTTDSAQTRQPHSLVSALFPPCGVSIMPDFTATASFNFAAPAFARQIGNQIRSPDRELGFAECLDRWFLIHPQFVVELGHQRRRRGVVDIPQRGGDVWTAREMECPLQSLHSLSVGHFAEPGFAGRKHTELQVIEGQID